MIVVKIELWPFGQEQNAISLGKAHIWNTGSGSRTVGNYGYKLFDKGGCVWKTGALSGFPRLRLLAWDLLYRVLNQAVGARNQNEKETLKKTA